MNIRISWDSIRFRISFEELNRLKSSRLLEEESRFPGGSVLRYRVRLIDDDTCRIPILVFDQEGLSLDVGGEALRALAQPRQKKGAGYRFDLETVGGVMRVSLEVDLFSSQSRGASP